MSEVIKVKKSKKNRQLYDSTNKEVTNIDKLFMHIKKGAEIIVTTSDDEDITVEILAEILTRCGTYKDRETAEELLYEVIDNCLGV